MNTTLKRQCLRPGPWLYVMGNPDLEWVPKTEEGKKKTKQNGSKAIYCHDGWNQRFAV